MHFQIFDKNGKLLSKFGKRGKGDGEIWYPAGVALDDDGSIYVADHGNHRIQVITCIYSCAQEDFTFKGAVNFFPE